MLIKHHNLLMGKITGLPPCCQVKLVNPICLLWYYEMRRRSTQ